MSAQSPSRHINDIPLWAYPLGLSVIVLLLSLLPGGSGLRALLIPIAGWSATIWLFRRYSWIRTFIYICLSIMVIGTALLFVLLNGSDVLGF